MGSANCKEYRTTPNPNHAPKAGDTGSYKITSQGDSEECIEVAVCKESEIGENEMKELPFHGKKKILLIKQNGKLSAIGNLCTHYGVNLNKGALGKGRVRCPAHGACFNITTGDIEDFPGLDSLPCYQVSVKDGKVNVRAKASDLANPTRIKGMAEYDPSDKCTIAVIGGGPAAAVFVETLRQEGFSGRIVMFCKEAMFPYDRVKVSKKLDIDSFPSELRKSDFYVRHNIEVKLGVSAENLSVDDQFICGSDGVGVHYDKLFIATGAIPIIPSIEGIDAENVFTVRTREDGMAINRAVLSTSHVVCLGTGFISLELASLYKDIAKSITLVGNTAYPLSGVLGEEIGKQILELLHANGIDTIMETTITSIRNNNGKISEVVLSDKKKLPCDVLILGTGVRPNTEFLQNSLIKLNKNGSIDVDKYCSTKFPGIYAGGDIANAPVFAKKDERMLIGHYQVAQYHGRIAALNAIGTETELKTVPFFWSNFFGKAFRYAGVGPPTTVKVVGSMKDYKFAGFIMNKEEKVTAVVTCGMDPVAAQFSEFLQQNKSISKKDIVGNDPLAWAKTLTAAKVATA